MGVVGGGAMGAGIAQVAASAGYPVVVLEVDAERAASAVERVTTALRRSVEKGRLTAEAGTTAEQGLRGTADVADLAGCALVIEAVAEDLALKRGLLTRLEQVVGPDCVLATNTSSLSIEALAAQLSHPSRLVGMHFFNPAPVMPLVEVVSGLGTSPRVAEDVVATAALWGKTPVRCASSPGFLVNRVARPYYSETLAVVAETGVAPAAVDRLFREAGGFRLGPLELTDLIGQDVNAAVTESVWRACDLDPRYRPSGLQRQLVDTGWLGRKTGRGFYVHPVDESPPDPLPTRRLPDGPVRLGPLSPLRALLARTGCGFEDDPALEGWARLPSGTLVGLTDGELATAEAARTGADVVLVDQVLEWESARRVGATVSAASAPTVLDEVAALLAAAGVAVTALPDTPGLLLARTLALLVDEAVDVATRQRVPATDVDRAVRLGLSYPRGPLEWGDLIGPARIVQLLDSLERALPGGRFRVSTPLRRAALTGAPLREL